MNAELTSPNLESIELERDIEISRREFAEGKGIPSDEVFRKTHEMLERLLEENRRKAAKILHPRNSAISHSSTNDQRLTTNDLSITSP